MKIVQAEGHIDVFAHVIVVNVNKRRLLVKCILGLHKLRLAVKAVLFEIRLRSQLRMVLS